jgi:hypothetical protein
MPQPPGAILAHLACTGTALPYTSLSRDKNHACLKIKTPAVDGILQRNEMLAKGHLCKTLLLIFLSHKEFKNIINISISQHSIITHDQIKNTEMGSACSTYGGEKRYIQNFGGKT